MVAQTNYFSPADLDAAGGIAARWLTYAVGDAADVHPRLDDAELAASGEIDEYLRRRGVIPPLAVPLEPTFLANGIALVLDYLTRWADRRPQTITDNAAAARSFFEKVATGRVDVDNVNAPTEATQIIHGSPFGSGAIHSVLDSQIADSDINVILPSIGGRGFL